MTKLFTLVWDDFLTDSIKEEWKKPCLYNFQIVQRAMLEKNNRVPNMIHNKYVTHLREVMSVLKDPNNTGRRGRVLLEHPAAHAAWEFWNMSRPRGIRWQIEAFIMAGADDSQLLEMFPSNAGVAAFEYFRMLFFNIAPYENNNRLIMNNIIDVAYDRSAQSGMECDLFWKIAARRYGNVEDFTKFMDEPLDGMDKALQQTLREIQEGSFMRNSAILSLKPNEIDERSIMTVNLAASSMFISHDNAHKVAEIAFQEKVGKVVDHLAITLIKSGDPLPDNAGDIKYSDPIHNARAASKAEKKALRKAAEKVLIDARKSELRMRKRYQVLEAD